MGHLRQRIESGEAQCFRQNVDGVLWFKDHLMVPKNFELHRKIMDETHCSRYSIHPGTNQVYQDLKKNFWWTRMKREIAKYVSECDTCRRIKADHLRPTGYLQPLSIPEWIWENICLDPPLCCPPTPLKRSHRPPTNLFLPPRAVRLAHPHLSAAHTSPIAQASFSPAFHHKIPFYTPDSARASPSSTPFR
jgi:hypothetical protein